MRGSIAGVTAALIAVVFTAPPALGQSPPADANCLGVVTTQRAVAHHDIGEHASSQDEPRLGLGNAAEEVLGDGTHVGEFGAFLGEIDGLAATHCP
jgi:hypothetical protein